MGIFKMIFAFLTFPVTGFFNWWKTNVWDKLPKGEELTKKIKEVFLWPFTLTLAFWKLITKPIQSVSENAFKPFKWIGTSVLLPFKALKSMVKILREPGQHKTYFVLLLSVVFIIVAHSRGNMSETLVLGMVPAILLMLFARYTQHKSDSQSQNESDSPPQNESVIPLYAYLCAPIYTAVRMHTMTSESDRLYLGCFYIGLDIQN